MNRSVWIALGFALLVGGYFGVRTVMASQSADSAAVTTVDPRPEATSSINATVVTVLDLEAADHTARLSLKGQTETARRVIVRAETAGVIRETPAREGSVVKPGAVLCRLDVEARDANIAQAQAAVDARKLEFEAADRLAKEGWRAPTQAASAKAALDAANAQLSAAKIERQRTEIRAPFAGVFNTRLAEIGDFLAPGGACGEVLELNPLLVSVEVDERSVAALAVGQMAQVSLSSGRALDGSVQRISRTANERTRTYTVEIAVANSDMSIPSGMTATVSLPVAKVRAHQLSPAALTLDAQGTLGVRIVRADNTAQFMPVTVLEEAPNGVWVSGLPETVRLIVLGQELVSDGSKVDPRQPAQGVDGGRAQ